MSLPLTDANGVVQATTSGAPVSWNAGLGYDVEGNLCVTSVASPADSYSGGRRVSAEGKLVISQSTPDGKPWNYNAGWPMDKNTGAIITQSGTPDPSEPRIAGVAVGPLGGVYMTEGGFTWTPEQLYLLGQVGAWYDPSDLSTMFTDAAGTTPVTGDGDPVGLILDKSGNGYHASQATSTARPLFQIDGSGKHYLAFDGVDDYLSTAAIDLTGTDKVTVFSGSRVLSSNLAVFYETNTNALSGGAFYATSNEQVTNIGTFLVSGTGGGGVKTLTGQPAHAVTTAQFSSVFTTAIDAAAANVNGVAQSMGVFYLDSSTGNFGNWPLHIGARSGATHPFTGNLYSLIIAGALYAPLTVFQAEHWVAEKTGVTLGTPGAPVNTVAPAVTGTPSSGNTLTCSQGTWTGAISYAYQWYDQGTPIVGATTATYALTDANKGWVMSCTVTATNVAGSTGAPSNVVEVALFPYSGSWIYQTPATGSAPAANCIVHASNQLTRLNVSTTNAAGQYVDFGQMRTGDVITINGQAYIVQATPTMYGSYASIPIDPTTQQPAATYTITGTRP